MSPLRFRKFPPPISARSPWRRVGSIVLVACMLATGCSDSGDAGQAISSQDSGPKPTTTPLTFGSPAKPTVTPLVVVTESGDAGDNVTTSATADPAATPTLVGAVPTPTGVPTLADAAFTNGSKVTTVGLDEVFFGMNPDDAASAASTSWVGMPDTATWPNCFSITPVNGPDGVSFWVFNRTVERVNISHPSIRTRSGYGVGTALADLQAALGDQLEVTDFSDGSKTAVFVPSDSADAGFRLIFDLRDDEVFRFRSGRVGVVELPDASCS